MANAVSNISKGPGTEMDPSAAETNVIQRTNYLIAIGIDDYSNNIAFPNLGGACRKDCEEVIKILTIKYGFQLYKYLKDDEAGIYAIRSAIESFQEDKEKNTALSNLVIYYSGHGCLYKPNDTLTYSCWVPQDCSNAGDKKQLYALNKELLGLGIYQELNVQHFAVISDACFSGGAINYSNLFDLSAEGTKGLSVEDERSCWAFCSSRSTEKSLIGNPGENSDFTKRLLEILTDNQDTELLIGKIKTEIEKFFLNNVKFGQTPFCERIGALKNNTGQFVFRAALEIINKAKKQKLLPEKLKSLNYKNQRDKLTEFKNGKTHFFTIISGPSDGGLKFLNKMVVCNSSYFAGKGQPYIPVEVAYLSSSVNEQVLELFNLALNTSFGNENDLRNHIKNRLLTSPFSIEFKFKKKQWLNEDKQIFVSNTAKFLQSVHNAGDDLKPLFIFIIDADATDYTQFTNDPFFNNSMKLIMPGIDVVDSDTLVNWYDSITNEEFDLLFKKVIVTDVAGELALENLLPGEVIRKICTASGCNELAIQLLDD